MIALVLVVGVPVTSALFVLGLSRGSSVRTQSLPTGCIKPPDGFLIIASNTGWNDSIGHGVPQKAWPILNVTQGQRVNITVCNTDIQAHGFAVSHYYDSNIVTVFPGQVLHVSFIADDTGKFLVYCSIWSTIHWAMVSGQLRVTAS